MPQMRMRLAVLSVLLFVYVAPLAAVDNELATLASSAHSFTERCEYLGPLVPIPKVLLTGLG
jgi:hypothetical protein